MEGAGLAIDVLGPMRITASGRVSMIGRNQRASILANLICRMGQSVSYDTLADELGTSRHNMMKAKAKLNLDLQNAGIQPEKLLVTEPDGYRLRSDNIKIDAQTFDETVSEAEIVVDKDASQALYLVTAALKLWANPFQGVPATFAIDDEIIRLDGVHRRAQLVRCAALLGTAQAQLVETEARSMLNVDPDDEAACHYLVLALGKLGRQFDALDELQRLNQVRAERGTEPSRALLALHDQIVRGEVSYEPQHLTSMRPQERIVPKPTRVRVNTSTNFVGNRQLLDRLKVLRSGVETGQPAVCWIEAGAGFGKTRLVEEWASMATTATFRQCWLAFRQHDDGAFRRLVELLSDALDIDALERARIGDDLIEEVLDQRLISAVLESASIAPVLLVVEDLHWADARSLGFLDRLVATLNRQGPAAHRAIMVVVTSRPDGAEDLAEALDRIRRGRIVSWLTIEPLQQLDVHQLLAGLGVSAPASSMVNTVCTVTAGNPLAIRTLLMRLDQTRGLGTLHDQTVITRGEAEVRQFSGLDSIVSSHVSATNEECRQVLAAVAVLGEQTTRHQLDELVGDPDMVEIGIGEAIRSGLLVSHGRSLFAFEHPVIAQAALAEVRPTDLQALHSGAARLRTEARFDASTVTAIADHLIRAGPLADDDDVLTSCKMAGELALEVASSSDANRYLSAALASGERLGVPAKGLASLRLLTATAAFRDHQIALATSLFRSVADHGRQTGDIEMWGQGLVELARCVVHNPSSSSTQEVKERLTEFLSTAETPGSASTTIRARAHQQLATLSWSTENYSVGLRHADHALSLISLDEDPLVAAQALLLRGLACYGSLDLPQALSSFEASTRAASTTSSSIFHHWGLSRAAMTNWALGEFVLANRQASEAAAAAGAASNWAEACLATAIVAGTCAALGQHNQATKDADHAQQLFHRSSFFWAGTLLLPVRLALATASAAAPATQEILDDWNRPLPLFIRIRLALDEPDTRRQTELRQRVARRQPFAAPTMANLPVILAAADLAVRLNDVELAQACITPLDQAVRAGVVVIPGQNRSIEAGLVGCRSLVE